MKRDLCTAGLYLAAFLPAALLAVVFNYVSIGVANAILPRFARLWVGGLLNVLPAAAAGVAVYSPLARWRRDANSPASRHAIRAAPLYALAVGLGSILTWEWRDPGFGLIAQLVVWPFAAALGGIAADVAGTHRRRTFERFVL